MKISSQDQNHHMVFWELNNFPCKKQMRFGQKDREEHLGVRPRRWCHGLFREFAGAVDRILTPSHILNGIMGDGFSNYQLIVDSMVTPPRHPKKTTESVVRVASCIFFWGHLKTTFQLSSCFPKVPLMCPC